MHTERVTFLTTPQGKIALAARAAARGISTGEYVRRRVEADEDTTAGEEAELAALVAQANEAIPRMRDSLDRSIALVASTSREIDAMLREAGLR